MKNEFKDGFIANLPIGISVFAYGSVLGVLCTQKGIALYELALMNIFIFAGSAQFVMVDMWSSTLDVLSITIAALLINLRYFLVGASLSPLFINSPKKDKFKYMHFATDESWAITMQRLKNEQITPLFLFGGGMCIFLTWFTGTFLGFYMGEFISNPAKYGLDFAFVAIFFALALSMFKGKEDLLPWFVTALVAVVFEYYFEGKLYIVVAAISGSLCAAFMKREEKVNG